MSKSTFLHIDYSVMVVACAMLIFSSIYAAVHNFRVGRKGSAAGFVGLALTFTAVLLVPILGFMNS